MVAGTAESATGFRFHFFNLFEFYPFVFEQNCLGDTHSFFNCYRLLSKIKCHEAILVSVSRVIVVNDTDTITGHKSQFVR